MEKTLAKKFLKVFPFLAVAILMLTNAKPARAQACFTDLANCYVDAAVVNSFWYRWARGLDCELNFVNCVRLDIIGR